MGRSCGSNVSDGRGVWWKRRHMTDTGEPGAGTKIGVVSGRVYSLRDEAGARDEINVIGEIVLEDGNGVGGEKMLNTRLVPVMSSWTTKSYLRDVKALRAPSSSISDVEGDIERLSRLDARRGCHVSGQCAVRSTPEVAKSPVCSALRTARPGRAQQRRTEVDVCPASIIHVHKKMKHTRYSSHGGTGVKNKSGVETITSDVANASDVAGENGVDYESGARGENSVANEQEWCCEKAVPGPREKAMVQRAAVSMVRVVTKIVSRERCQASAVDESCVEDERDVGEECGGEVEKSVVAKLRGVSKMILVPGITGVNSCHS
ncbi:hypothetical protein CERSUDRAFT_76708 [Gelatoporia subvermispora B]|uniref:Uncharacterized protein n=1 Tax=Ceriporiopsis subvermispora (strain B) TaxID=914234 RepID=M2R5S5_CERS8|nr:hypothetical protein CERSUDRAFT_76708 [Gelatoporia subvermispora B]